MKSKLCLLCIALFLLSGCWNYRELNEMAIVGAMGIDYDDETGDFITSAQIFNAKKTDNSSSGGQNNSPVTVYKQSGKTIHESLRKMIYESPRKLYIGHMDIVVLGKEIAENHLLDSLDFLFRDSESRKVFDLIVASEQSAYDILSVITPLDSIPSTSIKSSLMTNSSNLGTTTSTSFDMFMSMVYDEGEEAVLPSIKTVGDKEDAKSTDNADYSVPKGDVSINGLAVFKESKLVGVLNSDESFGYNILKNSVKQSIISYPCGEEGNYGAMEMVDSKTKIKVLTKEKTPKVNIEIEMEGFFSEVNCNYNLKYLDSHKKLIKKIEKRVVEIINSTLDASQKTMNSDFIGFGNMIYRNEYKKWKKLKDNWDEILPKIETSIKVKLNLTKKGSIVSTLEEGLRD